MFLFHSPLLGAGRLLESNREVGSREMTTDSRPPLADREVQNSAYRSTQKLSSHYFLIFGILNKFYIFQ